MSQRQFLVCVIAFYTLLQSMGVNLMIGLSSSFFSLCTNDSPTAAALFAKIDRNGLGYLGKAEVTELANLLGLQLSAEEVDQVIECMDLDNDGVVAAEEFKNWWKTPKLVRGAVYSPTADAANAQEFAHLYELPVSYDPHAAP